MQFRALDLGVLALGAGLLTVSSIHARETALLGDFLAKNTSLQPAEIKRFRLPDEEAALRVFERAHVRPGDQVLEIGPGILSHLSVLSILIGAKSHVVDAYEEGITAHRTRVQYQQRALGDAIRFEPTYFHNSVTEMDVPDRSYDTIFCIGVWDAPDVTAADRYDLVEFMLKKTKIGRSFFLSFGMFGTPLNPRDPFHKPNPFTVANNLGVQIELVEPSPIESHSLVGWLVYEFRVVGR